jgi:hypothetical protein
MAIAVTVGSNWVSTVNLIVSCPSRIDVATKASQLRLDLHDDSLDESVGMAPSSL